MNRDFRFRAWHKDAKEMLQSRQQGYQGNVFAWLAEGQPVEIMQYTGLKDKNGKEIYEGDIVRAANDQINSIVFGEHRNDECQAQDDERDLCNGIGFYFKHKDEYCFFGSASEGSMGYEVLGNIYENPELLENKP